MASEATTAVPALRALRRPSLTAPFAVLLIGFILFWLIENLIKTPADFYANFAQVYNASLPTQIKHQPADRTLKCGSSELSAALGLPQAGDILTEPASADGYPAYMQPALAAAVDGGVPGADAAWRLFQSRPTKPNYSDYPDWAIVPRKN